MTTNKLALLRSPRFWAERSWSSEAGRTGGPRDSEKPGPRNGSRMHYRSAARKLAKRGTAADGRLRVVADLSFQWLMERCNCRPAPRGGLVTNPCNSHAV